MDLAWAAYNVKAFDAARNGASGALNINPKCVDAYNLLGLIELKSNNLDEAIKYLESGKELISRDKLPYGNFIFSKLGLAYYRKGDFGKALESFEQSRLIDDISQTEAALGITFWMMGDRQKASEAILKSKDMGYTRQEFLKFLDEFSINKEGLQDLIAQL